MKSIAFVVLFVACLGIPASAQTLPFTYEIATEASVDWLASNFERTEFGTRADESRRAFMQTVLGSIGGPVKGQNFGADVRVSLLSDMNDRKYGAYNNRRLFPDLTFRGGRISEFEAVGYWTPFAQFSVGAGYSRFGRNDNFLWPMYNGFTETHSNVTYDGAVLAAKTAWTIKNRLDIEAFGKRMPRMNRTDSYVQDVNYANWGIEQFEGDSTTDASAWETGAKASFRIIKDCGWRAYGGFTFRRATTPFSNHLTVVLPTQIEETATWKRMTFGLTYGR